MKKKTTKSQDSKITAIASGEFITIPISDIDPSPFNYRKTFPADKLAELADSITKHGIIENLTVRFLTPGRFELVTGERRLRAAIIAGVPSVPAVIRDLTDKQVREIQISENLQREDVGPLEEADAILVLMEDYKSIGEVAIRIGKSKQFVYSRLRLATLIPEIREILNAGKLSLSDAFAITGITPESQLLLFKDNFENWQNEGVYRGDVEWQIRRYKFSLADATFDIRDIRLIPTAGACTICPSNTATLKTLFPEEAKQAICTNTVCFGKKNTAQFMKQLHEAIDREKPQALIFYRAPSQLVKEAIDEFPKIASMPQYLYSNIQIFQPPTPPTKEEWTFDPGKGKDPEFDENAFEGAMAEFETELHQYNQHSLEGPSRKGLLISDRECKPCLYSLEKKADFQSSDGISLKSVEAALKEGSATPELIHSAIGRLKAREQRAEELDKEKIQVELHKKYEEQTTTIGFNQPLSDSEWPAVWYIIFRSLNYSATDCVKEFLFGNTEGNEPSPQAYSYADFVKLTPGQQAWLLRFALSNLSEVQLPKTVSGNFLHQIAPAIDVDISAIESAQQTKVDARNKNLEKKIQQLEQKIAQLENK